jgi:predicted enzyme related to lactoylglutathione lyase
MKVIEIGFTGYPVTNLKRARQFYEEVLNLKVSRVFGNDKVAWVEYDIGPGTLAIGNMAPDWKPFSGGGSVGLEVDDFEKAVQTLREKHIEFVTGPFESPVCHMAVITDPDGNYITIHKRKTNLPSSS